MPPPPGYGPGPRPPPPGPGLGPRPALSWPGLGPRPPLSWPGLGSTVCDGRVNPGGRPRPGPGGGLGSTVCDCRGEGKKSAMVSCSNPMVRKLASAIGRSSEVEILAHEQSPATMAAWRSSGVEPRRQTHESTCANARGLGLGGLG